MEPLLRPRVVRSLGFSTFLIEEPRTFVRYTSPPLGLLEPSRPLALVIHSLSRHFALFQGIRTDDDLGNCATMKPRSYRAFVRI
jgi:hypothetical protein